MALEASPNTLLTPQNDLLSQANRTPRERSRSSRSSSTPSAPPAGDLRRLRLRFRGEVTVDATVDLARRSSCGRSGRSGLGSPGWSSQVTCWPGSWYAGNTKNRNEFQSVWHVSDGCVALFWETDPFRP